MTSLEQAPKRVKLLIPFVVVATWFGAGFLPKVPGTWGSLAALPFAWAIVALGGPWLLVAAACLAFLAGLWASARYMDAVGVHDPGPVVIDEVAAQWLTLAFFPLDPGIYVLGFLFFRVTDVLKPWPANWIDRRVGGPFGVMFDDVVAAGYAALALLVVAPWISG